MNISVSSNFSHLFNIKKVCRTNGIIPFRDHELELLITGSAHIDVIAQRSRERSLTTSTVKDISMRLPVTVTTTASDVYLRPRYRGLYELAVRAVCFSQLINTSKTLLEYLVLNSAADLVLLVQITLSSDVNAHTHARTCIGDCFSVHVRRGSREDLTCSVFDTVISLCGYVSVHARMTTYCLCM